MIYSCTIKRNVSSYIQSYVSVEIVEFLVKVAMNQTQKIYNLKFFDYKQKFLMDLVSTNLFNHYTAIWSKYFSNHFSLNTKNVPLGVIMMRKF